MLFGLVLILSAHLNAQTPSESRYRVGIVSSANYGFTSGAIDFTPPDEFTKYRDIGPKDTAFTQRGFASAGYNVGLFGEFVLSDINRQSLILSVSYQQQQSTITDNRTLGPAPVIINEQQVMSKQQVQATTTLNLSNFQCNVLYGAELFTSFRYKAGVLLQVLSNKNPLKQTYTADGAIITTDLPPDVNWEQSNTNPQTYVNKSTASQTASFQLGGVVGIDYSMNVGSFYLMPFVQYSMLFTTITKETPLRLHTLQAGIGASVYL